MITLVLRFVTVFFAMIFTIAAAGSMALVAANTWGLQCPRPIGGVILQIGIASVCWTAALSIKDD